MGQRNYDFKISDENVIKMIVRNNEETSTTTFCKDTRKCAWWGGV